MIIALQYHTTDMERTMSLARLLADLEPRYRNDTYLGLVCQPETPSTELLKKTIEHCSSKFKVVAFHSKYGARGWADGSGQLWTGTMEKFVDLHADGTVKSDCIFTCDGGDGIPLHNNWLDLMMETHNHTRQAGKMVTGFLNLEVHNHPHINANMILDLSIWDKYPSLHHIPLGASQRANNTLDMYHAEVLMPESCPSTVIWHEWKQTGITMEKIRTAAKTSIWLHGYKDHGLRHLARDFLLNELQGKHTHPSLNWQDRELQKILQRSCASEPPT
jgi:hypothetical protein